MRFSTRSKMSVLLSLVAIVAIIGGFMATGLFRTHATHAAAGSNATTIKSAVTSVGSGSLLHATSAKANEQYV